MAYSPQVWRDYPSGGTPISAARLNHMEAGIAAAGSTTAADAAQSTANTALSTANTALTKANNAQTAVSSLGATFEPVSGGFTVATGWSVNRANIIKIGRIAAADISLSRSGAAITVSASGNLTNSIVGTVSSAFLAWSSVMGLPGGASGSLSQFYITGNTIYLAAYAPSTNINTGDNVSFAGLWITAS